MEGGVVDIPLGEWGFGARVDIPFVEWGGMVYIPFGERAVVSGS